MTSKKINKLINDLEDFENPIYKSCIGEKLIPYIGWFWRTVNFDADECGLGIIPKLTEGFETTDAPHIGFMENNKWDYEEFYIDGDVWKNLKELIVDAIKSKQPDKFKKVDEYMQKLSPQD